MADYVVETHLSTAGEEEVGRAAVRVLSPAQELTDTGVHVRHLCSVFLSEDETYFHFFEAPSIDAVREVLMRAWLEFERIGPVVTSEDGKKAR